MLVTYTAWLWPVFPSASLSAYLSLLSSWAKQLLMWRTSVPYWKDDCYSSCSIILCGWSKPLPFWLFLYYITWLFSWIIILKNNIGIILYYNKSVTKRELLHAQPDSNDSLIHSHQFWGSVYIYSQAFPLLVRSLYAEDIIRSGRTWKISVTSWTLTMSSTLVEHSYQSCDSDGCGFDECWSDFARDNSKD